MDSIEEKIQELFIEAGYSFDETVKILALMVGSGVVATGKIYEFLKVSDDEIDVLISVRVKVKEQ